MTQPQSATDGASRAAIQELAAQTNRSLDEAREAYEIELRALSADAKVTTYLPVFAKRQARKRLLGG